MKSSQQPSEPKIGPDHQVTKIPDLLPVESRNKTDDDDPLSLPPRKTITVREVSAAGAGHAAGAWQAQGLPSPPPRLSVIAAGVEEGGQGGDAQGPQIRCRLAWGTGSTGAASSSSKNPPAEAPPSDPPTPPALKSGLNSSISCPLSSAPRGGKPKVRLRAERWPAGLPCKGRTCEVIFVPSPELDAEVLQLLGDALLNVLANSLL